MPASAGYPAFAVPLARAATGRPAGDGGTGLPPGVRARVQRAVASSGPEAAALVHLLVLLNESAGAAATPPAVTDRRWPRQQGARSTGCRPPSAR